MDARLDDALELLEDFNQRLSELEAAPPGQWARSVAWLIDRYATRKTAIGVAMALMAMYGIFQGLPLT